VQGIVSAARKELRAAVDVARDPSTGLKLGAKQRERLERTGMRQLGKVEAKVTHEVDTTIVEKLGEAARPRPVRRRVKPEELVVGARVKLRGIARRGVVLSKTGADTAEVQVGSLRMRVRADDVEAVEAEKGKRAGKVTVQKTSTAETQSAQRMGVPELHVRGLRVEEARNKVDKFLDDAVVGGRSEVRIVHGIGSGALKKALAEFLAEHPHVAGIKEAEREHGGAGVTVVTLRSRL
jgi:DNA mismatch repair protein MutS2